jgi:hypothetical protein
LTSTKVPVAKKTALNVDTGKQISREDAAKIMHGTAAPKKSSMLAQFAEQEKANKAKAAVVKVVNPKVAGPRTVARRQDPVYQKDYERGWKAGAGINDLTAADKRGEVDAYYDGFSDRSIGVPKWTRADELDAFDGLTPTPVKGGTNYSLSRKDSMTQSISLGGVEVGTITKRTVEEPRMIAGSNLRFAKDKIVTRYFVHLDKTKFDNASTALTFDRIGSRSLTGAKNDLVDRLKHLTRRA